MFWLLACADDAEVPAGLGPLSPVERGVRVSMALRGVRPSFEELDRLRTDRDALEPLVDEWLADPAFGRTVRGLWDEALQVRADTEPFDATGSLAGFDLVTVRESVQEGVLRTVEALVLDDRPYTDLVTGATAMANPVVARAWAGLSPYDPGGEEWQEVAWLDGRPAAGILSDTGLWVRWRSAGANAQRRRANFVATALLCEDFLLRDASIDTSAVADPTASSTALDSEACLVCHGALDPLASFFPFDQYPQPVTMVFPYDAYDETWDEEEGWRSSTGVPPDYYGLGGETLDDLAALVALDPRFPQCVARRHWSYFRERPLDEVPVAELDALQAALEERGSMKDLARSIVLDEGFADPGAGALRVRAEALPSMIEDLTGFRWTVDGEDLCCASASAPLGDVHLGDDGYRGWVTLWGGIDSPFVTAATHASSTTSTLILEEYAAHAAAHVVAEDLATSDRGARRLLREVDADTIDEAAVRGQLARLHLRVLGEELEPSATDATFALFEAVRAGADPARAWTAVLAALLSDPRVEYY